MGAGGLGRERDKVVLEGKYAMVGRQRQNHRERERERERTEDKNEKLTERRERQRNGNYER